MATPQRDHPATPVLIAAMAVAVLAGAPLVFLLWDALNHLLTGDIGDIAALPTLVPHVGAESPENASGEGADLPSTPPAPETP